MLPFGEHDEKSRNKVKLNIAESTRGKGVFEKTRTNKMCATNILTWNNNNIRRQTNEQTGGEPTKLYKVKHYCEKKQDTKHQREYADVSNEIMSL